MAMSKRAQNSLPNDRPAGSEQPVSYRTAVEQDRLSWLERRLAYFGGAYIPVLLTNLTDKSKYVRIGLFVFVTAIMAFTTMMFALNSVFFNGSQKNLIIPFALIWASIIFIIDWGLVATMRKEESFSLRSLKTYTSIIFPTLLRIFVAGLISFTISKPLEVKLFENRLAPAIAELKALRLQNKINELDAKAKEMDPLPKIDTAINSLIAAQKEIPEEAKTYDVQINQNNDQISEKEKQISALETTNSGIRRQSYGRICTETDVDGNCTKYGTGWLNEGAKAAYNQNRGRVNTLRSEISQIRNNTNGLTQNRANVIRAYQEPIKNQISDIREDRSRASVEQTKQGSINAVNKDSMRVAYNLAYDKNYLMIQIDALETLANDPVEGGFVFWVKWLIFAIIFVIDLMPIFIKLLSPFGPYEQAIADLEAEKRSESKLRRSMIRQEYRSNAGLVQRLARSQRDIIRQSLEQWRIQQLNRLEENPETSESMFSNNHRDQ